MDERDLMIAIAARVDAHKASIGIEGVSYPALNIVPASPWAMVRQSLVIPSEAVKARATKQVIRVAVDIVLLVTSQVTRPGDAARLDGLIAPIRDLFDASAVGGNINTVLTGLDGSVNRIWQNALTRRPAVDWGESGFCHAAIITLDTEFTRAAEVIA